MYSTCVCNESAAAVTKTPIISIFAHMEAVLRGSNGSAGYIHFVNI